jgi:hypothetical protein
MRKTINIKRKTIYGLSSLEFNRYRQLQRKLLIGILKEGSEEYNEYVNLNKKKWNYIKNIIEKRTS